MLYLFISLIIYFLVKASNVEAQVFLLVPLTIFLFYGQKRHTSNLKNNFPFHWKHIPPSSMPCVKVINYRSNSTCYKVQLSVRNSIHQLVTLDLIFFLDHVGIILEEKIFCKFNHFRLKMKM